MKSGSSSPQIRAKVFWLAVAVFAALIVITLVTLCNNKENLPQQRQADAPVPAPPNAPRHKAAAIQELIHPAPAPPNQDSQTLISQLFNKSAPLKVRRQAARALAKL